MHHKSLQSTSNEEIGRIKKVYRKRNESEKDKLYHLFNLSALYISQEREKAILKSLSKFGIRKLSDKKILDVGCGAGGVLRDFIKYGANPENCFGIDLLEDRTEKAKRLSPNIGFICGSAEVLPYEDASFNIVLSFTVFSSIFDNRMKQNIANEMFRVIKPSGIIIWYDFWVSKPTNPDVKGIGRREIKRLFPECQINIMPITLAPPLTRVLAPYSWFLCYMLEKIPILRTHYLGVFKKVT